MVCPGDDFIGCIRIALLQHHADALQIADAAAVGSRISDTRRADVRPGPARYHGFAELPAAARSRIGSPSSLAAQQGVHLIVAQSADGSLIVGDSHDYGRSPDPFSREPSMR